MLDDDPDDAQLVAWTTTPWTLPSNLALCVNPDFEYVKVNPHHQTCLLRGGIAVTEHSNSTRV